MSSDRPTLHVTNWSSRALHGPGKRYTIMARPRKWEHGDGQVAELTPDASDLAALRAGRMSLDVYRRRFVATLPMTPWLRPGKLYATMFGVDAPSRFVPVADGDTLCCACSRAAAARGECHRSWAAEALAAAGWRVLLDGVEVRRVG